MVVAQTVVTRFPITEVVGKVNGCTLNECEPKNVKYDVFVKYCCYSCQSLKKILRT